jgi:NhaP-type Na+/H+ or K+/H+ antiporter
VVAIFRNLGVPKRLSVLLEGESLLNDGTAIVFFMLAVGLVTGTVVTADGLVLDFVKIVGIGALPMVLVLSPAKDFPHQELLVAMTFGSSSSRCSSTG